MKWLKKVAATPLTTIAKVVDSLSTATNDRTNAPSIHAVREAVNNNWLSIYPVGSIYMSVNNVNPSTIFGGTWQQIKDRFLLSSGDTYISGNTGGSATNTLSVNNLPSHKHQYSKAGGTNQTTLILGTMPKHHHIYSKYENKVTINNGTGSAVTDVWRGETGGNTFDTGGETASHAHTLVYDQTGDTTNVGSGQAVNNMPPYLVVNVWVRTA